MIRRRARLGGRQRRRRSFRASRRWNQKWTLSWSVLRSGFDATVVSAAAPALFRSLRMKRRSLRRFRSAADLLAYLAKDLSADLDAKDAIYADLVRGARQPGPPSSLAHALLWIGLWPGLSAAFSRRLWFWQERPDDLVSEMTNGIRPVSPVADGGGQMT